MLTRYVTLPRKTVAISPASSEIWDPWDTQQATAVTVLDYERRPIDTGLLDQHGTTLYRVDEPAPMGFRSQANR